MEHHHDSYTQAKQQTPLGDHTTHHNNKKLESPTCTDFDNNHSENSQFESAMEQLLDETHSYHSQQPVVTLDGTDDKIKLDQHDESIENDIPTTMNNLEAGPNSFQGPGDIDETVDKVGLESEARYDNTSDTGALVSDLVDSTIVAAEITMDINNDNNAHQGEPSSSETEEISNNVYSNDTTSINSSDAVTPLLKTTTNDEQQHVYIESLGTAVQHTDDVGGDTSKMEIQQLDDVDQLNTNMTSDDDNGESDKNCIMNQSVDHADAHSYNQIDFPPIVDRSTGISSTTNRELDSTYHHEIQSTDLPSQQLLVDNNSETLDYTTVNPTTNTTIEIPTSTESSTLARTTDQNSTMDVNGANDYEQQVQVNGDDDEIIHQLQSMSTVLEESPISISTQQHQLSHNILDDRANTTIFDEHTHSEISRTRHVWESDHQASECRRCSRRFSFLVRRHHCRRCGQVVCDRCSSHRMRLPVEEIVEDPLISTSHYPMIALNPQRVCESCIRIPIKPNKSTSRFASSSQNNNHSALSFGQNRLRPMNMERTNSQQSLMADCPVCGTGLLGMRKQQQENHLNQCLNAGSPTVNPPRYIIYTLTDGTTQLGDECPICFEEFQVGDKIARMVCLCSYHRHCLRDWLERGKGCPIHYDSNFGAY